MRCPLPAPLSEHPGRAVKSLKGQPVWGALSAEGRIWGPLALPTGPHVESETGWKDNGLIQEPRLDQPRIRQAWCLQLSRLVVVTLTQAQHRGSRLKGPLLILLRILLSVSSSLIELPFPVFLVTNKC